MKIQRFKAQVTGEFVSKQIPVVVKAESELALVSFVSLKS